MFAARFLPGRFGFAGFDVIGVKLLMLNRFKEVSYAR
jgi:hypothetical protein